MTQSTQGVWIDARSWQLARYESPVVRHSHGKPKDWRQNRAIIAEIVQSIYPDAQIGKYHGGVLDFRWNGSEGSGSAFNGGTTPGPVGISS